MQTDERDIERLADEAAPVPHISELLARMAARGLLDFLDATAAPAKPAPAKRDNRPPWARKRTALR